MVNNFKKVYSQVYGIICSLSFSECSKIPEETINFFKYNKDYKYNFVYNSSLTLEEQHVLKETKIILLKLYMDYFASKEEKNKIRMTLYRNECSKKSNVGKI